MCVCVHEYVCVCVCVCVCVRECVCVCVCAFFLFNSLLFYFRNTSLSNTYFCVYVSLCVFFLCICVYVSKFRLYQLKITYPKLLIQNFKNKMKPNKLNKRVIHAFTELSSTTDLYLFKEAKVNLEIQ